MVLVYIQEEDKMNLGTQVAELHFHLSEVILISFNSWNAYTPSAHFTPPHPLCSPRLLSLFTWLQPFPLLSVGGDFLSGLM